MRSLAFATASLWLGPWPLEAWTGFERKGTGLRFVFPPRMHASINGNIEHSSHGDTHIPSLGTCRRNNYFRNLTGLLLSPLSIEACVVTRIKTDSVRRGGANIFEKTTTNYNAATDLPLRVTVTMSSSDTCSTGSSSTFVRLCPQLSRPRASGFSPTCNSIPNFGSSRRPQP